MIWIERRPGALWAVGRAVNPQLPARATSRDGDDYVFEGYELEDALEAANETLEDDLRVLGAGRRGEQAARRSCATSCSAARALVLRAR